MKKAVILLTLSLFLSGCGSERKFSTLLFTTQAERNRDNLNKVEIGMSKSEIREIMGKPHKREASGQTEWWFYQTEHSAYVPDYIRYTPIAFEDGKVIGWGRNFYKDIPKEYDIRIDQRIKRE